EVISIKGEIGTIEKKTHQFLNRIVEADSTPLITAYENQVRTLEEQRITLKEKVSNCGRPLQPFDEAFRTAIEFLGNPHKLWASNKLEHKRTVLKLAFTDKLPYDKNTGFRTPEKSMPLSLLEGLSTPQSKMVLQNKVKLLYMSLL
ncbi:MAG: recombinase, partial [Alphaproteobacteria bacterium]|nr:recombinase [Alphaproteobacteria bacterium]